MLGLFVSYVREDYCPIQGCEDLLLFSFESFMVLTLTFRSVTYFESIFFLWCKVGVQLYSFACRYIQVFQYHFLKKISFPIKCHGILIENQFMVNIRFGVFSDIGRFSDSLAPMDVQQFNSVFPITPEIRIKPCILRGQTVPLQMTVTNRMAGYPHFCLEDYKFESSHVPH